MAFQSAAKSEVKRGGKRLLPRNGIRIARELSHHTNSSPQLRISIGEDLMKSQRWVSGDRVVLEWDAETKMARIRRVTGDEYGWTLSVSGKDKAHRLRALGKPCATVFKPTVSPQAAAFFFPNGVRVYNVLNTSDMPEGLTFEIPSPAIANLPDWMREKK